MQNVAPGDHHYRGILGEVEILDTHISSPKGFWRHFRHRAIADLGESLCSKTGQYWPLPEFLANFFLIFRFFHRL